MITVMFKSIIKNIFGERGLLKITEVFRMIKSKIGRQYNDNVKENLIVKDYLHGFEVHLVEHCNLDCWGCNHYSPLAEKEYLDINTFEHDIKRMSELTNQKIDYLYLMGGEPLLHPNIIEFFKISRKYFKFCKISLFTNGILLLKQENIFWEKMREYNISILASKYPILHWDKIEKRIIEKKILLEQSCKDEKVKLTWFNPIDITGSQDKKEAFIRCGSANRCIFLYNGRLFTCNMAPNFRHLSKYFNIKIKTKPKDSINIHKAKDINKILKFLAKPIPACRYCYPWGFKSMPWKRTERNINEWVITKENLKQP